MLIRIVSLLMIFCLLTISNQFVFGQSQLNKAESSQQSQTLLKGKFFDSSERANELLDNNAFAKIKKDSITTKAMQDADKAQQKKNFVGMNTTTAIVIGAAIAAVIVIVLATKGKEKKLGPPIPCDPGPCR